MAAIFDSLATTKANVQGYIRGQLPAWGQGPTQFLGKVAAVCTLAVYSILKTARQIDVDALPRSGTSAQGLQDWGNGLGLPQKQAAAAGGGVGTFTGAAGTIYPINSSLTASDGVTKFFLVAAVTVGGGGTVSGNINATTAGAVGNMPVNTVLTVDAVPPGGAANVTLTTALANGTDIETNAGFLARIQARLANPPKAVTGPDLRGMAEGTIVGAVAKPTTPASRAYVYPLRSGTGTADVVITQSGSGTGRLPTSITSVDTALQGDRNVTAVINTLLPSMPAPNGLAIVLRVTPTSTTKFPFDWNSNGAGLTVAAYNAGTPSLTLNVAAPADFIAAVAAGSKPRLQINPTGSTSSLPQMQQVTAYNAGTKVCTLVAAFTDAPQVNDVVNAGGVVVAPVALSVRALVDGLGPSKVSGYQDPNDASGWDDTLRIDQLRRVALNTLDSDAVTPLVLSFPAAPTINGAATDKQGVDASSGLAPELLYAKSIAIVP